MKSVSLLCSLFLLTGFSARACNVTISAPSTAICFNDSVTLTASGAVSYVWSASASTSNTITVSPATTTTYTVVGTDALGCIATATKTITVKPLPVVSITASVDTVCPDAPSTLSATGANNYTWMPGSVIGQVITVSPVFTTTYTVKGVATATGCSNTATKTIVVRPAPKPVLVDSNIFTPSAMAPTPPVYPCII